MKQYETFIFEQYNFLPKTGEVFLSYSLDDEVKFTEIITLPKSSSEVRSPNLEPALFALHLVAGISYFKTCLPKKIEIRSGTLNEQQAEFWNTLYTKGLGEFFFQNNIDFRGLINFPYTQSEVRISKSETLELRTQNLDPSKALVPIGGGKDSLTAIEALRKSGCDITLFRIGAHPIIDMQAQTADLPLMNIQRKLPQELFDLNEQGALNGHVPITAFNSFVAVVCAQLHGFDSIVFSNERSANEGNTEFHGEWINHQWSKSFESEQMIANYIQEYINPTLQYFSLLRPFSELHITKMFTEYSEYMTISTSCNANWRILQEKPDELWGTDPKSAFIFALYSAYIPREIIENIFKKNLFEDADVLQTYRELLGLEGIKPFECVGTPEETKAAMYLAYKTGDYENSFAMDLFKNEVLPTIQDPEALVQEVLTPHVEHAIPEQLHSCVPL